MPGQRHHARARRDTDGRAEQRPSRLAAQAAAQGKPRAAAPRASWPGTARRAGAPGAPRAGRRELPRRPRELVVASRRAGAERLRRGRARGREEREEVGAGGFLVGKRNCGCGAPDRRAPWLGFGGGRASAGWARWTARGGGVAPGAGPRGGAARPHAQAAQRGVAGWAARGKGGGCASLFPFYLFIFFSLFLLFFLKTRFSFEFKFKHDS
jgi:hypothetical protein